MIKFNKYFSTRQTAQSKPIPGTNQKGNNAGGFAWAVDNWTQLERFLILGTEGGTFYVREQKLTVDNAQAVLACIEADGPRVVRTIVEISQAGRAPKNDPALFALAMCAGLGDDATRKAALEALPQVARIGTHLFHFMGYVEAFRGWGRGLRRAIGRWYTEKGADKLAFQAVKYQQRDGWSHRDALRLAHPVAPTESHNQVFHWITQGWDAVPTEPLSDDKAHRLLWGFEQAKRAQSAAEIVKLIDRYNLPWEAIPTAWQKEPAVWQALLPHMGLTALIRNLGRLTHLGVIAPGNRHAKAVVARLGNRNGLRKARIHPIAILSALMTYKNGRGVRGKLTWEPVTAVIDALDAAFYKSFDHVVPTGKRIVTALDVSSSMGVGSIAGVPGLTPRVGSAAMSLVTAATESDTIYTAFSNKMVSLNISPRQRLDDVVRSVSQLPFGGTDCALPMLWALENRVKADAFIIYTDSETWFGKTHPVQALRRYREKTGIPAKLIVVGMVSNRFSIADPTDGGMLDVVGFNTAVPGLMADFVRE